MKRPLLPFWRWWQCLLRAATTYQEQRRQTKQQQQKAMREDSAALKVAVMPTMDCLPIYLAKERRLFDTLGVDIRLKHYMAQMDCDTAFERGRVEMMMTDLVRAERLRTRGMKIDYLSATPLSWQLFTGHNARVKEVKQLEEKMIGMTRFSATDLMADLAADSGKVKPERLFKIQVNDLRTRVQMLRNQQIDAAFLPEPQATEARQAYARALTDSRRQDLRFGVIAVNQQTTTGKERAKQIDAFKKAYNQAVDSITKNGIARYRPLIVKYMHVDQCVADSIKSYHFEHIAPPREQDIQKAKKWYERNR